jgi:decaprenyl-phosphate phosphoribosyltransferase
MTTLPTDSVAPRQRSLPASLVKLARPHQWAKGAFVVIGPMYAIASGTKPTLAMALAVAFAFIAFAFASSSCYIVNDIRDVEADRLHPRKRNRPIASGAVPVATAWVLAGVLVIAAIAAVVLAGLPQLLHLDPGPTVTPSAIWLGVAVVIYVINTNLYSAIFKHHAVLDVISLAAGFVLRVLGGCAAAGVAPSSWLLNVTFFISMFLAFGKRLGERRTMGDAVASTRKVQQDYTDELLRMTVVVTAVATLVTYAGYVQAQTAKSSAVLNLLWFTMLPATYGLLRCIVLLERGEFDDPTELASKDRPFQFAAALFVIITVAVMFQGRNLGAH